MTTPDLPEGLELQSDGSLVVRLPSSTLDEENAARFEAVFSHPLFSTHMAKMQAEQVPAMVRGWYARFPTLKSFEIGFWVDQKDRVQVDMRRLDVQPEADRDLDETWGEAASHIETELWERAQHHPQARPFLEKFFRTHAVTPGTLDVWFDTSYDLTFGTGEALKLRARHEAARLEALLPERNKPASPGRL
jgi:hypothetical protein